MKRIALLLLFLAAPAFASDPGVPHPNQGLLDPIVQRPDALALTAKEAEQVEDGRTVQRYVRGEEDGWGVAVNLVEAPAEVVWDTILAYDRYPDWVANVTDCTVYKRSGDDLYVDMQMSVMGIKKGMYTINTVKRSEGWMAWTLDYSRKSDVQDMVGYWRVEQISSNPPITRLDYSTQMKARGVPDWLVKLLTKKSLKDGTRWVKERAEEALSQR
jgi:coenzyme Q-binding protein COQ10